jgi:hypothetical protein
VALTTHLLALRLSMCRVELTPVSSLSAYETGFTCVSRERNARLADTTVSFIVVYIPQ